MAIDDEKSDKFEENYSHNKAKFEIYGKEMIQKIVTSCGKNGKIHLPPEWIGTKVKVVKC